MSRWALSFQAGQVKLARGGRVGHPAQTAAARGQKLHIDVVSRLDFQPRGLNVLRIGLIQVHRKEPRRGRIRHHTPRSPDQGLRRDRYPDSPFSRSTPGNRKAQFVQEAAGPISENNSDVFPSAVDKGQIEQAIPVEIARATGKYLAFHPTYQQRLKGPAPRPK